MRKRLLHKPQEVNCHILRSWKIERKAPTAHGTLSPWPISTDIYFDRNIFYGAKMKTKSTIDGFEVDKAVLIFGEDEFIVPRNSLPQAEIQGLWLEVEVEDDLVITEVLDE